MWLVDATLRETRANQFGLLGFGGEYRQKPNNLSAFREDAAHDIFMSWFKSKNFALTGAYVDLGTITTHPNQSAWYLALQASS